MRVHAPAPENMLVHSCLRIADYNVARSTLLLGLYEAVMDEAVSPSGDAWEDLFLILLESDQDISLAQKMHAVRAHFRYSQTPVAVVEARQLLEESAGNVESAIRLNEVRQRCSGVPGDREQRSGDCTRRHSDSAGGGASDAFEGVRTLGARTFSAGELDDKITIALEAAVKSEGPPRWRDVYVALESIAQGRWKGR